MFLSRPSKRDERRNGKEINKKMKTKINIEVIDNGYLIEVFIGRSKVGSKFFKEIPDKPIFKKYITDCKSEFKELSDDEWRVDDFILIKLYQPIRY